MIDGTRPSRTIVLLAAALVAGVGLVSIDALTEIVECVPVETREQRGWSARDSHTTVRFNDRFWLFGGWFDSNQENLRDAWVSSDGRRWEQVVERLPFAETDYQAAVVAGSRLYLLGGWADGRLPTARASSNVWWTSDGLNWALATAQPGWSPRLGAAAIQFRDRIWLLGGVEDYHRAGPDQLKNDVWNSEDGVVWTRVLEGAPWSPRAFSAIAVFDDHLYLMGGGSYRETRLQLTDVWRSRDGLRWERVRGHPAWSGRIWHSAVVVNGALYLMEGWRDDPPTNLDEVWRTRDGERWELLPLCPGARIPHASRAVAAGSRIYQFGGATDRLTSKVYIIEPEVRRSQRRWSWRSAASAEAAAQAVGRAAQK
jgi:hypothetical protein